jgi:hypothetical protein
VVSENDADVRIELKRNPKSDRAWFDECVIFGIADTAARQTALQAATSMRSTTSIARPPKALRPARRRRLVDEVRG